MTFEFKELDIKGSQIESILGYKEGEDTAIVSGLIDEILSECNEISNISAQYSVFTDIRFNNDLKSVEIKEFNFYIKKIVFGQLKKSESVAVFLCTAGAEIGNRSKKAMSEKDYLKGYVYGIIGSEIVEAAADLMQTDIEKEMNITGLKITNRFSPGYCGWDVSEQHNLFRLIPDNFCGIRLTAFALMDPVKSISGIIGIGKNVKYNPYTCRLCDLKDCVYRKIRESKVATD